MRGGELIAAHAGRRFASRLHNCWGARLLRRMDGPALIRAA